MRESGRYGFPNSAREELIAGKILKRIIRVSGENRWRNQKR